MYQSLDKRTVGWIRRCHIGLEKIQNDPGLRSKKVVNRLSTTQFQRQEGLTPIIAEIVSNNLFMGLS